MHDPDAEETPDSAPQPPDEADASSAPVPALRSVQAEPVQVKGGATGGGEDEMVVVLQDSEHLAPQPAVLSPAAYALVQLFDGRRSATEIAELFEQMYGQEVPVEQVHALKRELDQALFLNSPHFEKTIKAQLVGYLKAKVRPEAHAGQAYPEEPPELRKTVEGFFTLPGAPGVLPPAQPAASHSLRALMLPHIDLRVGGAAYAHGYKELLEKSQADLFVILGVAHQALAEGTFYVSRKHFCTPFGEVKTERGLAGRLQKKAGLEEAMAEFAHKSEHSIEFQTTLLQTLLHERAGRDFEIVPILCGSVEPFVEAEKNPCGDDRFKRFVETLGEELAHCKRRWCVIASVDLSHVGPKFGHSTSMDEKLLKPVARADRKMLGYLERLDASGFFQEILRTQNSRNVDAVMAMLALLTLGEGQLKQGKLLHYAQNFEAATKSAVTYASMSFE
ncbi:MAG: MEMO1 family protein [Planctomycetota bacterium]